MTIKTYREAVKEALAQEMERDERVVLIGEDLRGGHGGNAPEEAKIEAFGGVLGVTKGLWTQFGSDRVIDTPITESAIIGMAAGAAAQHSQSPYNIFATTPGLKVVVPSTPYDVKGLLIQSIRDDDPVVFCEHKMLYDLKGEVPDESYTIPLGVANYTREGEDVTIIALSAMVHKANQVADKLAKEGISVEVVDPRTISPLDEEGILESVASTGRVVIVDESAARFGFAHDVAALIASQAFHFLKAPVLLVTPPHTPVPFSPALEKLWIPGVERIEAAVRQVLED
ncbi:alpha-ketoacid dehydrogenase subunit beta [Klebsiella pneumoniae]|uniref:alpha-ketoacid dehydrogenase subunit beta n=1 Tax=Klebsiella pneumoniae TaxID=573 RepID=UPI00388EB31C